MANRKPVKRNNDKRRNQTNQLRIIAGSWRGRKLNFPSIEGLRPTPDRVRETLFNWLSAAVPGARCLDLFAGSGALGLEALSRGASHVDLVDASPKAAQQLRENRDLLQGQEQSQIWQSTAQATLNQLDAGYDIVFLDPPFHQNLLAPCLELIEQRQLLADHAWVYIETNQDEPLPTLAEHWQLHREKVAGQVCYRLFSVNRD